MKSVIFICTTCEYTNRMKMGVDGFELRKTEFISLNDAWEHLQETTHYDHTHDIVARVEEE